MSLNSFSSPPGAPARRRTLAVAMAAAAVLAGCSAGSAPAEPGAATKPASAAVAPASPTKLGTLPASTELGLWPHIDAVGSTVAAVAPPLGARTQSTITLTSGALWVSQGGAAPQRAQAGGIPVWAQPHVGTDANGRTVVVYPRCAGETISTCDLYAYDVGARTEAPVTGANSATSGEIEGTMQHGYVAWTRATGEDDTTSTRRPSWQRSLWLRSTRGPAKLRTTRGGTNLALRAGIVAQNRQLDATQENWVVELARPAGRVTRLQRYGSGMDAHHAVGLRFFGPELRYGIASLEDEVLVAVPLARPAARRRVTTTFQFETLSFATRGSLVALALEPNDDGSVDLSSLSVPKALG